MPVHFLSCDRNCAEILVSLYLLIGAIFSVYPSIAFAAEISEPLPPSISLESAGGTGGGHNLGEAMVSMSLPLGDHAGAQVHGLVGGVGGTDAFGTEGRLWLRDPARGRFGVTASRFGIGSTWGNRFGAEAEGWLGPVTLAVSGGKQNGHVDHLAFASASIRFYPDDNLMLSINGAGWGSARLVRLGMEWQPGLFNALQNPSIFAHGGANGQGGAEVMIGLRFRLSHEHMPLLRQHREYGPPSVLADTIMQAYPVRRIDNSPAASGGGAPAPPPPPGP